MFIDSIHLATENLLQFVCHKMENEFLNWAFNQNRGDRAGSKSIEYWNEHHGSLYTAKGSNRPASDILIMRGIWLQKKEMEEYMDKKMHQVSKRMKTAERDIEKGNKKGAVKVLKKAVKKNEKLVAIDRDVRDPMIKECKKMKKNWRKK